MSTQSIFNAICKSLNSEGKLSQNFMLRFKEVSPNKLSFMPGAKDGIGVFHFDSKHPEIASKKIVKFLKSDWEKCSTNSQSKIAELLHRHGSSSVIDHILNSIREDHKDGWGKTHTVQRLEPTSGEIREWILRKGCANAVMDAYLGLECANKGNLISALCRDSFDDELFDGISVIIDALLDEGPVEGISVYKYAFSMHPMQHPD